MTLRKDIKILSLDAAGYGCISQLETLGDVMHHTGMLHYPNEIDKEILPCEYFDIIGGIGLGGLIAIFLANLRMSVKAATLEISSILEMAYSNQNATLEEQTSNLKGFLEDLLRRRDIDVDMKLEGGEETHCGAFIITDWGMCIIPSCLRTYEVEAHPKSNFTVIEAALATFSLHFGKGSHSFVSSERYLEFLPNNPIRQVIWDAFLRYSGDASVASILSIGPSKQVTEILNDRPRPTELFDSTTLPGNAMDLKMETEVERAGIYYRLSGRCGSDGMLAASSTLNIDVQMEQVTRSLLSKEGSITLDELTSRVKKPLKPHSDISPHFLVRETLQEAFHAVKVEESTGRAVIVITGPSGCGKSEVVKQLLHMRDTSSLQHIFWVNGSSETSVKGDILRQVRDVSPVHKPKTYNEARKFFKRNPNWILVYTNVDDTKLDIPSLVPGGDQGTVFFTSSSGALGILASKPHLHFNLDGMSEVEAIQLISKSAERVPSSTETKLLVTIAGKLDHLPVSLVQAGCYMKQTGCTNTEYLSLLERCPSSPSDHKTTSLAIGVSWENIPQNCRTLLQLLSISGSPYFPLAVIPSAAKQLFRRDIFGFVDQDSHLQAAVEILEDTFLSDGAWRDQTLWEMASTLQKYSFASFISAPETILVSVYPLVQRWALTTITPERRLILRDAASRLLGCVTSVNRLEQYLPGHIEALVRLRDLGSIHVNQLAAFGKILRNLELREEARVIWKEIHTRLEDNYGANNLHVATAAIELAATYDPETLDQMEMYETQAVSIRETILGPHHFDTIRAKRQLGGTFAQQKRYKDAILLKEDVVRNLKAIHTAGHPDVLEDIFRLVQGYLSEAIHDLAEYSDERATSQLLELLDGQMNHFGKAHPKVHVTMELLGLAYTEKNLHLKEEEIHAQLLELKQRGCSKANAFIQMMRSAKVFSKQQKYPQAIVYLKKSLEGLKGEVGECHSATLHATCFLAQVYQAQGRLLDAQYLLEEALSACGSALVEADSVTNDIMIQLARSYSEQKRCNDAEALQIKALAAVKDSPIDDKAFIHKITIMMDLAGTYTVQKRYAEEIDLMVKVVEQLEAHYGPRNKRTLIAMAATSKSYEKQGLHQEAERLQIKLIEGWRARPGPTASEALIAMNNLAFKYEGQGRLSEAEDLLKKVLDEWRDSSREETRIAIGNLAHIYNSQKRFTEAIALREELLDWHKAFSDETAPETAEAMAELATSYEEAGHAARATPLRISLMRMRTERLGSDSIKTLTSMSVLGRNYCLQGRENEAIPIYIEAIKGLRRHAEDDDHGFLLAAMGNLAGAYVKQGRYLEALPLRTDALAMESKLMGSQSVEVAHWSHELAQTYHKLDLLEEAERLATEAARIYWRLNGVASLDYQRTITLLEEIKRPTISSTLKWIKSSLF